MAISQQTYNYLRSGVANEVAADDIRDRINVAEKAIGAVHGATITVGAEAANVINVAVQLTDELGNDVASVQYITAFLSDASTGIGITAGVPDGGVAIGTDGAIIATHVTDGAWLLQSESDGDIDLDLTDTTGTPTWYLVVVLPNGKQVVSDAITFA